MHDAVAEYLHKWSDDDPGRGLDIGGRNVNGHARALWPNVDWTVLDLRPGDGVDIVADAADWIPSDGLYDVVTCTEVLEHTERWRDILRTCERSLKVGGLLVITCAAPGRAPHSGVEATAIQPGEHYRNIPHTELAEAIEACGLTVLDARQTGFDTQAAARR